MTRRRLIALLVVILVFVWFVLRKSTSHEPSYQGRTLSEWMNTYETPTSRSGASEKADEKREKAIQAVQAIGTNAIPTFLEWLQTPITPVYSELNSIFEMKLRFGFHLTTDDDILRAANDGFSILGTNAMPAVPTLTNLIAGQDFFAQIRAFDCLTRITQEKEILLPVILQGINNSNPAVKVKAAIELYSHWPEEAKKIGPIPGFTITTTSFPSNSIPPDK